MLGQATITVTVDGVLGSTPLAVTGKVGTAITPVIGFGTAAATAAGLVAPFAFSTVPLLPGATTPGDLTINPTTGAITGRPATAVSGANYTVSVTDKNGVKATGPITVTIGGSLLPATQSVNASVGSSTFSRTMTASGMTAPVTYSISPALQAGLLFNTSTGVVSGIPRTIQATTLYDVVGTDANGVTGKASLTVTVSKAVLSPPIIGSVIGGAKAGSLQVFFTEPAAAPSTQIYTVEVYDSFGDILITSVDTSSSPVTIDGLTPGDTYQIVVVAKATAAFDRSESVPKTGVASLGTTVTVASTNGVTTAAAGTINPVKTSKVALSQGGFVLAVGSQVTAAKNVLANKPAASVLSKAPAIRITINTYSRIVVPGVKAKGLLQIKIKIGSAWVLLGSARANARHQLKLPAFAAHTPGTYPIQITAAPARRFTSSSSWARRPPRSLNGQSDNELHPLPGGHGIAVWACGQPTRYPSMLDQLLAGCR